MNIETFTLFRKAMGVEQEDIAAELDINVRTVQRWEAGQNPLPEFAQAWMADRWQGFLDRIDAFMSEVDDLPSGHEVELAVYSSRASLERAGSTLSVREANAMNRALAVLLGLADLQPVAHVVPVED